MFRRTSMLTLVALVRLMDQHVVRILQRKCKVRRAQAVQVRKRIILKVLTAPLIHTMSQTYQDEHGKEEEN